MDSTTMSQIGLGGGILSILSVIWAGIQYMNHRNIRSRCCGIEGEMGIDIDSPKPDAVTVPVKPVEVTPV
jgi:hypothetical protein